MPHRWSAVNGVTRKLLTVAVVMAALSIQPSVAFSAPETTISNAPSGYVDQVSHDIVFSSDDPDASFQCKIDEGSYEPCSSPYKVETAGAYGELTLYVRAIGMSEIDLTPAQATWHYLPPFAPPVMTYKSPAPTAHRMKLSRFNKIAGAAFSTSGIREVRVMLRLYVKGEEELKDDLNNKVCTHIHMKTGKRIKRDCFDRPYARATGKEDWSYTLPKRVRKTLKPGKYTIEARGFNGMDAIQKKLFVIRLTR